MRKLCSERSVCAPHNLSAGMSSGPKASLSVRVLPGFLAMPECRPAAGPAEGRFALISSCGSGRARTTSPPPAGLSGFGLGCGRGGRRPGRRGRRRRRRGRGGARALLLGRSCPATLAGDWRSSPSVTSSNCRPNCTDGSKKPLIASNGTASFSGMPPNDRPTSKPRSFTLRSQNWCCRMMVISSGYCARSRSDMRTPSACGVEGDVEMMVARQALFLGGVGEHVAHHAAQRLLGQKIVADMVGHGRVCMKIRRDASAAARAGRYPRGGRCHNWKCRHKMKVEASVARCLRTPPNRC